MNDDEWYPVPPAKVEMGGNAGKCPYRHAAGSRSCRASYLQGGERMSDDGTMHGGQDGNSQVRAPYVDRDVAADLAYLKIAWGKRSVSDVIRDLIDHYKESLSKLSK